ncbi:unnamed protein product [Lathyrus sativus]|nr:unnamed protein product [Lathyrus sativus]
MARLWFKLLRLQAPLCRLSKQISNLHQTIAQARNELLQNQESLIMDRMNTETIEKVKTCTDNLIQLQEFQDQMLRQRTKINWLREGDTNSSFFYAYLKSRTTTTHIS